MILTTERLILRPWCEDDAASLFEYAKDPEVGPIAGWPVHPDIEYSKKAIAEYLSDEGVFAVVLEGTDSPIGSIGVLVGKKSNFDIGDDEGEIGYWIGVPLLGTGPDPGGNARNRAIQLRRAGSREIMVRLLRRQRKIKASAGEVRVHIPPHRKGQDNPVDRRHKDRAYYLHDER